jgi:hypothetical protein
MVSQMARVALNQQTIIHSSMEMGMLIITSGRAFSYIRESYQQLREEDLLVIGCHM